MSRRMDCIVSDSLGGLLPNQVYATLEILACSVTLVHPCREDQSIRIAVSTVKGRFMLKPDSTTTNYILYLLVPSFLPRGDVEGGNLEALLMVITTYYYTFLQQLLLYCYFNFF